MSFCIATNPSLIQKALLQLITDVYSATLQEEKITAFCHYTIIINQTLQFLKVENPMQVFLVDFVICSLVNLVSNEREACEALAVAACVHLKRVLQHILSGCTELIEKLLVAIVSTLVPIARSLSKIGECCIDVLNYLIVENGCILLKAVECLDAFPEEERFESLSKVYDKVRYRNKAVSLEDELRHFLNTVKRTGGYGCRSEGLKHMKKLLGDRKQELKSLYQKLGDMRGFAEDVQDSLLHQLICALVKLTRSENLEVSLEASRCLGELGPADLTTLVLQTDLDTLDFKYTHFELVTGKILGVFTQYILDPDIEVVGATCSALYKVLQCKERKSVLGEYYFKIFVFSVNTVLNLLMPTYKNKNGYRKTTLNFN